LLNTDIPTGAPAARAPHAAVTAHRASLGWLMVLTCLLGACASKPPAASPAAAAAVTAPAPAAAPAASTTAAPAGSPAPAAAPSVVEPQVARRDLKLPNYPSRDFEIGLFTGTYSTQNFGTSSVSGIRLGYHITEDFFVNLQYGQTKVSDDSFRQILPGGVFVNRSETLKYYTLAMGYNLLPGEVFFGRGTAKLSQGYILAGAGTTEFAGQKKQTIDIGFGLRLLWNQRLAFNAEVRDHLFSLDLLGRRETTQNPEIAIGLSVIF
jgi:outer membrane beta-barrel protein